MYQPPPPPRGAPPRRPTRVEPVPGTGYGLAIFGPPAATSGQAISALAAGIAALLVSLLVGCLGLLDAASAEGGGADGWGALVGGAFAVLTGFLGTAALGLGSVGLRRTRPHAQPAGGELRGRGLAIAGMSCGGAGLAIAACSLGLAVIAALG